MSYTGIARIGIVLALLAVAAGLAWAGARLPFPVRAARPGRAAVIFMLLAWVVAIQAFLLGVIAYGHQERHDYHIAEAAPANPIAPVTFVAAGAIFVIVLITTSSYSPGARLASAVIAALAAPMIFELPFNLIIMTRTYPPIPPDPAWYRIAFFLPLFFVEITTLSFLTLPPMVSLSRVTFFCLALMFVAFALWSLAGFAYPSAPVPIALNVLAKILAFVTALSLFLPGSKSPGDRAQPSGRFEA